MWCDVNVTWTCDIWKRNHRWHKIHCSVQYPLFWPLAPKAVVPPCPLTMIEVPESNLSRGCLFPVGFLRTSIVDACWTTSRRTSKNCARIWFRNARWEYDGVSWFSFIERFLPDKWTLEEYVSVCTMQRCQQDHHLRLSLTMIVHHLHLVLTMESGGTLHLWMPYLFSIEWYWISEWRGEWKWFSSN